MTIDERLEKLAERQDALAQSMELHAQITIAELDKVNTALVATLDSIKILWQITSSHEARINRLEDRQ